MKQRKKEEGEGTENAYNVIKMEIKPRERERERDREREREEEKDINYSTEGEKVNDQPSGQVHSTETGADQSQNSSLKKIKNTCINIYLFIYLFIYLLYTCIMIWRKKEKERIE